MNKPVHPPSWLLRFFRWFCHPDYQEDIEGDLLEMFQISVEEKGSRRAKWIFFFEIFSLIKINLLRTFKNYPITSISMYKNYFKIAWRGILRQKLYSFLNIGGLAVGLTSFMLIFLYVQHELSYDHFYSQADRIYRIYTKLPGDVFLGSDKYAYTPARLGVTLEEEFPEVSKATTLRMEPALLSKDDDHFWEEGLWADPHFFEVFGFPFLQGNPTTALEKGKSIVLTQSLAQKIFGSQNPIGQTIAFQNDEEYTVTGVIQNPPNNISFKFTFILSFQSNGFYQHEMQQEKWSSLAFYTFFKLNEGANPLDLQDKMSSLVNKYVDYGEDTPVKDRYLVQAISELHLETDINFDIGQKGNTQYIYFFSVIAMVILTLACINYMNLAIARSLKRAREVGLRKTIGALRIQLIQQFLVESILITFIALLLALGLSQILIPIFGSMLERPLTLDLIQNIYLLPSLIILVLIVGVFSGSYPALIISSLNPIEVLRGRLERKFSGIKIREWLIVGQYIAAITLIFGSLTIYRQFQFIQQKELGYNKDHVISIQVLDHSLEKHFEAIKNKFLSNPQIIAVTSSRQLPTHIESSELIRAQEGPKRGEDLDIYETSADYDFLNVFGIELIAGRNFSPDFGTDLNNGYIINESASQALGWTPQEAIGKRFTFTEDEDSETRIIIGVIKDFHMHSMRLAIKPLMIRLNNKLSNHLSLKIQPENLLQTIASIESTIKEHSPYPFEYAFLDEKFDQLYKDDIRLGKMFGFFTILSILIASLGLFGLAAFTAERRTKEIGIRKVLGASLSSIIGLLSRDFLRMVLIGFIVSIPIAWYFMNQWLQDFAYRIEIQWWMFAIAGLSALLIAFLTISYQSIKAALANPVDALRNE